MEDRDTGPGYAEGKDPRVYKSGRDARHTSLDLFPFFLTTSQSSPPLSLDNYYLQWLILLLVVPMFGTVLTEVLFLVWIRARIVWTHMG